jgi:predicted ATPase
MPTSPLFVVQKYQEYLFCSKTSTFYKFEADAVFAGVQTHEPTDAKDYGVPATFHVGVNYTWKDAHSWFIRMIKHCKICHHRKNNKKQVNVTVCCVYYCYCLLCSLFIVFVVSYHISQVTSPYFQYHICSPNPNPLKHYLVSFEYKNKSIIAYIKAMYLK